MTDLREEFKKQSRKPTAEDKSEIARLTILKGISLQAVIFVAIILTYTFDVWNLPSNFQLQLPENRDY